MSEPIISRAAIRARAQQAHAAGQPRTAHNMPPGAALADWLAEYDRLAASREMALESRRAVRTAKARPPLHSASVSGAHIDPHQVLA